MSQIEQKKIESLIRVFEQLKVKKELLELIKKSLPLTYNQLGSWTDLCFALRKSGNYHAALADADRPIFLKPDYANAILSKLRVFEKIHKYEDAKKYYEMGLKLKPD